MAKKFLTNVDLNNNDATSVDSLSFNTSTTDTPAAGKITWDDGEGTLSFGLKGGNVNLSLGQNSAVRCYNGTGSTIPKGSVVYISGAQGQRPSISLSDADTEATSSKTLGVTAESMANGAEGIVTTFGILTGIDTSAYTAGQSLWLSSTAGAFTGTQAVPPAHLVFIGYVISVNASSGRIFVNPQNGYELGELHNVLLDSNGSIADNEILAWDSASSLWKNQTSAEAGLLDTSSTNQTKSGYITAPELHATTKLVAETVGGDEGGEILLGIAQTNTTLSGTGVTIDVYQNKLRFFEQGGSARGFYIDISTGGAGVGTNLVGSGSASNSFTTISTPSGTSPVADSSTDTLTLTAGTGITITGDATTDSITIASTITDTNWYPTAFAWTGGTTAGPTGSLTGTGMSAVSYAAIPSASATASGIVTTAAQTFAGTKTFSSTISGSIDGNAATVTNGFYTTSTFNLGTTSIAVNRASGSQSLTGINIDGNAGTVTNGAYVNAANAFTGANTFTNATGQTIRSASTQDGIILVGRAGGTTSLTVTLIPTTLTASRTLTLPDVTGTIVTTGDTGSVTNTMLAGSITTAKITGLATSATTDTTDAANISTGTLSGNRGVTSGSTSSSFIEYNGTTATAGQWDGGTTAPSGTTRLNYGGYLYATRFYGDGSNLTSIPNSALSNSAITINSASTSLGGSVTLYAGTTTLQTSSANQAMTGISSITGGTGTTNITFQSAATSATSTASGTNTLTTGNASGTTSNSGALTISTGTATGTSGNISIDVGNGTAADGTISIGTGNATSLSIGKSAQTTTFNGDVTVTGTLTATVGTATNATNATNTAITNDTTTATAQYVTWVGANTGNNAQKVTSTKLTFVPSTGVLSATTFSGSGASLTSIPNSALTNSTISGISLGSNLATLTISSPLSGTSYNGSTAATIALASGYGDTQNPYASKTANYVLAAPNGSAGVPTFRALVAADIPDLSATYASLSAATLTFSSATTLNINGASPTIASSSTGTLTLFNTNLLTVNAFGAATSATIGYAGTATSTTNIANSAAASTATNTLNLSTSVPAAGGTRTINIGTGNQTAGTSNINIGSGMTSGVGNITIGSGTTSVSMNGTWTFGSSTTFALTGIASGNWTGSSSLYNAAISGRNVQMLGSPYSIACASTSSIRYKDYIKDFSFDKDKLLSLNTKSFKYKRDIQENGIENATTHYGLIAEDLDSLGEFEWLLDYTEEGLPDYIYWGERMPQVLFSISKQLNEENKQMKQQIQELQIEKDLLLSSIAEITSRLDAAGI